MKLPEMLLLEFSYYKQLCNTIEKCKIIFVSALVILYVFFVHIPVSETIFVDLRTIIALFLFLFLFSDFKRIKLGGLSIPISILIFLFLGFMLFSISWSLNLDYGYYKAFGILLDIIPTILISIILFENPNYLKSISIVFVTQIIGIILVVLLIVQGGLNYVDISENFFDFGHIGYGRFLGFAFIIGTFALFNSKKKLTIVLLTNSFLLFGLFLSGHRVSLMGGLFFSFVLFVYKLLLSKSFYKETVVKYFFLISISIILLIMFSDKFPTSLLRNKSLLISNFNDIKSDGSFNARLILYDFSIDTIKKNPICGVGLGGFNSNRVRKEYSSLKYPHNIFLEILTEQGSIGFLLFVSVLFLVLLKLPHIFIYWIVILYAFWLSLFYGVLHDQKLIFIFFYFLITKKPYLNKFNRTTLHG